MTLFIIGIIIGVGADMVIGMSVVWWQFHKGFWMVNPERRDDYPKLVQ